MYGFSVFAILCVNNYEALEATACFAGKIENSED
jgi:hypothetical protein